MHSCTSSEHILQFYSGGIFDTAHCSSTSLNHAMVITGYGTYKNKKYWLVKNRYLRGGIGGRKEGGEEGREEGGEQGRIHG